MGIVYRETASHSAIPCLASQLGELRNLGTLLADVKLRSERVSRGMPPRLPLKALPSGLKRANEHSPIEFSRTLLGHCQVSITP